MRSTTLPMAPPRMQAIANEKSFWPACDRSIQTMKIAAATPMAVKNQRCQPEWSARNEKAAPVLCARTTLKKLVT
ncbi:hypothetical protein D9M72_476450 [compost metagenome]